MSRFSLTVLVDNMTLADRYFIGEPGLSFLIHTDQETILFDTGYSEVFLSNAQKMGKSLLDLDYVVFSHGHLDHTGGISALIRHMTEAKNSKLPCKIPRIISYLLCFCPRPKFPHPNVGSPLRDEEIKRYFPTNLSEKPVWITEDLVFLGEIPRGNSYEKAEAGNRMIILPDGSKMPDHLIDDSSLAYRSKKGIVIITGCSHSGVCNIIE